MSKAERLAAKITEGIMFGHDHPNLQHELDRMNAAAHLRALDASHQRLKEALERLVDNVDGGEFVSLTRIADARAALEQAKDLS